MSKAPLDALSAAADVQPQAPLLMVSNLAGCRSIGIVHPSNACGAIRRFIAGRKSRDSLAVNQGNLSNLHHSSKLCGKSIEWTCAGLH